MQNQNSGTQHVLGNRASLSSMAARNSASRVNQGNETSCSASRQSYQRKVRERRERDIFLSFSLSVSVSPSVCVPICLSVDLYILPTSTKPPDLFQPNLAQNILRKGFSSLFIWRVRLFVADIIRKQENEPALESFIKYQ